MALTFGKGNRSIAFNPTSAFPLDARSYFESYEAAKAAAAEAQAASSTETQYYFGQDIVVVENGIASFYIIQPDGTLGEVGGKVEIDEQIFIHVDGKLSLLGFADAVGGAQLIKKADGTIGWVKPDTTTVEGLSTAVEGLRTDLNTLTENVYTKEETDTKIATAIAATPHLKRVKVDKFEDIDPTAEDAEQYIYMVPSGLTEDDNKYYEYIVIDGVIEPVGAWEVNLDDYITDTELEEALKNKVDAEVGKVLIDSDELERLAAIPSDAEKNYINSVDETFFSVAENRQLTLLDIAQSKIIGLDDALREKVSVEEGKGLSSNDFTDELYTKLVTLNLNDISNLKTSVGSLEQELYGYTDADGNEITGLIDIISSVQANNILLTQRADKADSNIVTLTQRADKADTRIGSLETALGALDTKFVTIENFNKTVGSLDFLLTQQTTLIEKIDDINERLTWGDIPEVSE